MSNVNSDLEILTVTDKTGEAHTVEIWNWLMGRVHSEDIAEKIRALINRAHADLKDQGREDWVGGFSIAKRYRCTLTDGEYVPVLYLFTYLVHPPLKKNFTSEQFKESFDVAMEYVCYLRPDETESEFIAYIEAVKGN